MLLMEVMLASLSKSCFIQVKKKPVLIPCYYRNWKSDFHRRDEKMQLLSVNPPWNLGANFEGSQTKLPSHLSRYCAPALRLKQLMISRPLIKLFTINTNAVPHVKCLIIQANSLLFIIIGLYKSNYKSTDWSMSLIINRS